ncbi:hypothetical protein D3C76_1289780 [compost metagenome]
MENIQTEIVNHLCAACDYDGKAVQVDGYVLCPRCGCPDQEHIADSVDEDAVVEYIQDELMKEGIIVTREDIGKIFELEEEFMVRQRLINIEEKDGDPPDA